MVSLADFLHFPATWVEWCKTHAQANHWSEEVELLFEEKHQILQFLGWHAGWWLSKATTCLTDNPELNEGLIAYAGCQAALHHKLTKSFAHT
ncbi:hypothetical protein PAXRUDRAFT_132322 [Paxillus rubicundulus Ve08.2h10]|uniref:Uncharacterized protein n=1 Tax=Paxillus rubicundulus Ve08.2h10 TaxID=930991 RepID=A0A0D0E4K1_9AGAM|nr:hypothetical protein PAXRUDRAFT_132322 [Paxillus rubicundulus Ve08.2h10]